MANRPVVSLIVITYRQERFVRESLRSALMQTYQPLEVIVCDDCSPDGTYAEIADEVASYRGPHMVLPMRNETNLGLAGNLSRAWAAAQGDLVVVQAGDDISLPHRVERLAAAWMQEPAVDCVFSDCSVIDADGNDTGTRRFGPEQADYPRTLEHVLKWGTCWVAGCTAGYSRSIVTRYGPLNREVVHEDHVLPFRAMMGRGIRYVDEVLVQYRVHGANLFQGTAVDCRTPMSRVEKQRWASDRAAVAEEWVRAWQASGRQDGPMLKQLDRYARERRFDAEGYRASRMGSLYLAARAIRAGVSLRKAGGLVKRHFLRIA